MKPDITRQSLSSTNLLFVLLLLLFWGRGQVAPQSAELLLPGDVAFGALLSGWLASAPGWITTVFYLFFVFINALLVARIAARNMLYVNSSFLPVIFFVAIACGLSIVPGHLPAMLAVWLFIVGSQFFIAAFRRGTAFDRFFRGGLAMGLIPLLWAPGIVLWMSIPIALYLFRSTLREAVVAAVGALLPIAVYSYVSWIAGGYFLETSRQIITCLVTPTGFLPLEVSIGQLALECLLVFLIFLSIGTYLGMARSMRTRPSRIVVYFIAMLAVCLAAFLLPCRSVLFYPVVAVCAAVIAPIYFVRHTGIFPAALYVLILLCVIGINLFPLIA